MNNISTYLKLCRLDHITKHLFVVPGTLFAIILVPESEFHFYKIIVWKRNQSLSSTHELRVHGINDSDNLYSDKNL